MASSLPTPSASAPSSPRPTSKPILWIPTVLHPVALKIAEEYFEILDWTDTRASEWYKYATASVVTVGRLSREDVERADKLKIVTRNGVGYDSVPIESCRKQGIVVTNQPGCNATVVAEIALGLAISVARKIAQADRKLRSGEPTISAHYISDGLDGKTLGLIGQGDIARATAKKFYGAFDTPILVYSPTSSKVKWTDQDPSGLPPIPHRRVDTLEELLKASDVVSIHCPKNDETTGLIGEKELKAMKKTAIILNTARGGIIDESALFAALESREIAGAGLDVVDHEPPSLSTCKLLHLPHTIVLPHIGAQEDTSQKNACVVAVETAISYLKGEGIGKSVRVV
ncbi:hypothetical protein JCM5353_007121 [Sporobolomyces roseus]